MCRPVHLLIVLILVGNVSSFAFLNLYIGTNLLLLLDLIRVLVQWSYHVSVNKLMEILDEEKFVQLRPDTTHDKTKAKLKFLKHLLKLLKNNDISVNIYDAIRLVGSVWPQLYGLPKTHKENVLLSPNMSIVGLAQQKLANGSYSQPIMLSHIVDDTFCVFDSGEQW